MNELNNWVFTDPYEATIDLDENSAFRKALKSDVQIGTCGYDSSFGSVDGPIFALKRWIDELTKAKQLKNYVILTTRPSIFNKTFISNNVIDVKDRDPVTIAHDVDWVFCNFGMEKKPKDAKIFFYADPHYFHRNIIRYCNRPWNSGFDSDGNMVIEDKDVAEMNSELIRRYNEKVSENDIVYCLGDVAFGKKDNVKEFVSKLNGHKFLVKGNHDRESNQFYLDAGFEWVYDRPIIIKDFIMLSHTPLQWVKDGDVYFSIYGHVHNQEMYNTYTRNSCCACVERHNYTPVSLDEIIEKCKEFDK